MPDATVHQRQAIQSEGNVLVLAGAGTGKTRTLVERCLTRILAAVDPCSLEQILLVTFTDSAATEIRNRLRGRLESEQERAPDNLRVAEQLALVEVAPIATLHSLCHRFAREHFHELELDPDFTVIEEARANLLAEESLDSVLQRHYAGRDPLSQAVVRLVVAYGGGRDEVIRGLVRRIHAYAWSLPDPERWLATAKATFTSDQPPAWEDSMIAGFVEFRAEWLTRLAPVTLANVCACRDALANAGAAPTRPAIAACCALIAAADGKDRWPYGSKGDVRKPIQAFFADAEFLGSIAELPVGTPDPLQQDWDWCRPHLQALIELTREFGAEFTRAKRNQGGLDFSDLEQVALRLLWDPQRACPTAVAEQWRDRLRYLCVDEYQDINAAQDLIIRALSGAADQANRFLVGDVKQSIYRFRLANPALFQRYAEAWSRAGSGGVVVPMRENFRSHEAILDFVNHVFAACFRSEVGGVAYDENARLNFGDRRGRSHLARRPDRADAPRVELHVCLRSRGGAELDPAEPVLGPVGDIENEARLVGHRLRRFVKEQVQISDAPDHAPRTVEWRDMVVLLRSPRSRAETYARVFHDLDIPLITRRTGLFGAIEISDILNLLRVLDNPLQDLPLLAVLRSPLVGLSLSELAAVRQPNPRVPFWTALQSARSPIDAGQTRRDAGGASPLAGHWGTAQPKIEVFLDRHQRWRQLARRGALARCVETVLDETHYEDWLRAQPRGAQQIANVQRFLALLRRASRTQSPGLFRFLEGVAAQQEAEYDPEPAVLDTTNAVRLMSVHQSKGSEFPIVVLAGLGQRFNRTDLAAAILLDEEFGLCPLVKPETAESFYPSLPYWRARRRQQRELAGEELRLLYVAATRAGERLVLVGTTTESRARDRWCGPARERLETAEIIEANCALDWLGPLIPSLAGREDWLDAGAGESHLLAWQVHAVGDSVSDTALPATGEEAAHSPETDRRDANPSIEPAGGATEAALTRLRSRLAWRYPELSATHEPAKVSVTTLRRRAAEEGEEEAQAWFPRSGRQRTTTTGLSATERGLAHHRFLQFLALTGEGSTAELRAEAVRLREAGRLTASELESLDLCALAAFWAGSLGRHILAARERVQREVSFTVRLTVEDLRSLSVPSSAGLLADEYVVVQGVADLVVFHPDGLWLVDFKTDEVRPGQLGDKVREYTPQLALYALALGRIHRQPVTEAWLHFLAIGESVSVACPGVRK